MVATSPAPEAVRAGDGGSVMSERWVRNLRVVEETVVGCVEKLERGEWNAYGCWSDWQDTDLGSHGSEKAAKRAVERWVTAMEGRG